MNILEALSMLDVTNDGDWTNEGLPTLARLKELTGQNVTRGEVPVDFNRFTAPAYNFTPAQAAPAAAGEAAPLAGTGAQPEGANEPSGEPSGQGEGQPEGDDHAPVERVQEAVPEGCGYTKEQAEEIERLVDVRRVELGQAQRRFDDALREQTKLREALNAAKPAYSMAELLHRMVK